MLSVILHVALLMAAAHFVMRIATPSSPIAVTLLEVAPPPPGAVASAPGVTAVAPSIPDPIPPVIQPVIPKPEVKPQRPVIQRRQAKAPPKQPPQPPVPAPAAAPPESAAAPADSGGAVPGGVAGGVPGGKVGGTVGGQGDVVMRADQVATAPALIKKTLPEYPPDARRRGVEGAVVLEAVIDRNGAIEPDGIRTVESIPIFDAAAIDAIRSWRFKPGRDRDGRAVRVRVTIPLRFRLR